MVQLGPILFCNICDGVDAVRRPSMVRLQISFGGSFTEKSEVTFVARALIMAALSGKSNADSSDSQPFFKNSYHSGQSILVLGITSPHYVESQ